MSSIEPNEMADLVKSAISGNNSAFDSIYHATAPRMLGLAKSILKHDEDALDIVQESYLYAFRSLSDIKNPSVFPSWLYTIVLNRCKNHLTRTRPKMFALSLTDEEGEDLDTLDDTVSFQPEEQAIADDLKRIVWEMVESLPDDQRICVLLYYYQEMKLTDIAKFLDVSENTVKSRLNYARKKLLVNARELERSGTILHGVSLIPLLIPAANQAVGQTLASNGGSLLANIASQIKVAGTAASISSAASSVTGAAKATATALTGKIAIGVAAATIIISGTYLMNRESGEPPQEPSSIIATESEPIAEPPTPYTEWEGSVADSNGAPIGVASLDVRIAGNVIIDDSDIANGNIYLTLAVGDEFTADFAEIGKDLSNSDSSWKADTNGVIKQLSYETLHHSWRGEKPGEGSFTTTWTDSENSLSCTVYFSVK